MAVEAEVGELSSYLDGGSSGSGSRPQTTSATYSSGKTSARESGVVDPPLADHVASSVSSADYVASSVSSARAEPFTPVGNSVGIFLKHADAFENMRLDSLEHTIDYSKKLAEHLGGYGKGWYVSGKRVRYDPKSQRPSLLEPEIWNSFSSAQKTDQIKLVKAQKRHLDKLILSMNERLLTTRGHITKKLLNNSNETNLKATNLKATDRGSDIATSATSKDSFFYCFGVCL